MGLGWVLDFAREALLRAEVSAAQARLATLKDAWFALRESDLEDQSGSEILMAAIGDAEDLLRGAERARSTFLARS
jgi:hypothetical protein